MKAEAIDVVVDGEPCEACYTGEEHVHVRFTESRTVVSERWSLPPTEETDHE
jgi:hypothetical protein